MFLNNKIICGDSLSVLKSIKTNSIDLIFADPPYWMRTEGLLNRVEGTIFEGCDDDWDKFACLPEYEDFTYKWLAECKRVLKNTGSIWVIGSMQCIYTIGAIMQKLDFWFLNDIIWHKKNPTPNFKGTRLNNSHETLIWATKSKNSKYTFNYKTAKELNLDTVSKDDFEQGLRKQLGSVWRIAVCSGGERLKDDFGNKLHSTQKPEELLYRIINISSRLNDTVLDPFGGTMTTAAVAKRSGRNFITIEQNELYCKYGEKRLAQIEPKIGDIEKAIYDIKPPRAKIVDMISSGYLKLGEAFFLKDGKTIANLAEREKLYFSDRQDYLDIHTAAAMALGGKREKVNGFTYWYVLRDNKLVCLDEVRKKYREEKLGFVEVHE